GRGDGTPRPFGGAIPATYTRRPGGRHTASQLARRTPGGGPAPTPRPSRGRHQHGGPYHAPHHPRPTAGRTDDTPTDALEGADTTDPGHAAKDWSPPSK